jgi:carbon storage regulator
MKRIGTLIAISASVGLTPRRSPNRYGRPRFFPRGIGFASFSCGGLFLTTKEGQVMLVLSRRIGEEIVINDNIRVRIVAVQGNRVKLGIVAPEHVTVHREEIHRARMEFADAAVAQDEPALAH